MKNCPCSKSNLYFFKKVRFRKKVGKLGKYTDIYKCDCMSMFAFSNKKNFSYFENDKYRSDTDPNSNLIFKKKSKKNNSILKITNENKYYCNSINDHLLHYQTLNNFSYFKNKNVLEFGCGSGGFLKLISSQSNIVAGIEPSKFFRKLNKKIGNKFHIYKDLNQFNFYNNTKFDIITCFSSIEHIWDINRLFTNINKVLNKNGYLILGCINANDYRLNNKKYLNIFFRESYTNYFTHNCLIQILKKHNFKLNSLVYKERYDFDNYLKFPVKKKKILKKNQIINFKKDYKYILEKNGISDYMYLVFQKKN